MPMTAPWDLAQQFILGLQQQNAQTRDTTDRALLRQFAENVNRQNMGIQQGYNMQELGQRNEYATQADTTAYDRQIARDRMALEAQTARDAQQREYQLQDNTTEFQQRRDLTTHEQQLLAEREALERAGVTGGVRRYGNFGGGGGQQPQGQQQASSNPIFDEFMGVVSSQVKNPYGLAAIAATGERESGFSADNVYGEWSDPSESGQPGQAGGAMSWRGPRLAALRDFAARVGDNPAKPSPKTQGMFMLQENPQLIQALNNAKSPDEAIQLMNQAWAFAGWDRPSPEAAARLMKTREYAANFEGGNFAGGLSGSRRYTIDDANSVSQGILQTPVTSSASGIDDEGIPPVSKFMQDYLDKEGLEPVARVRLTEKQLELLPEEFFRDNNLMPDLGDMSQMNTKKPVAEYIQVQPRAQGDQIQNAGGLPRPRETTGPSVEVQDKGRRAYRDGKLYYEGEEIKLPE